MTSTHSAATLELRIYSPAEVAKILDPSGERITPRSVRTEIQTGRLKAFKFAGKLCVRHDDLMRRLGGDEWQSETRDRNSSSSSPPDTRNHTISSGGTKVDGSASVRRARAISDKLKQHSENSSPRAPESPMAPVIPMRS